MSFSGPAPVSSGHRRVREPFALVWANMNATDRSSQRRDQRQYPQQCAAKRLPWESGGRRSGDHGPLST